MHHFLGHCLLPSPLLGPRLTRNTHTYYKHTHTRQPLRWQDGQGMLGVAQMSGLIEWSWVVVVVRPRGSSTRWDQTQTACRSFKINWMHCFSVNTGLFHFDLTASCGAFAASLPTVCRHVCRFFSPSGRCVCSQKFPVSVNWNCKSDVSFTLTLCVSYLITNPDHLKENTEDFVLYNGR